MLAGIAKRHYFDYKNRYFIQYKFNDVEQLFVIIFKSLSYMKRNSVMIYLVIYCLFSVGADWVIDLMDKIRKLFLIYLPELHSSTRLTGSAGKEKILIIG